MSGERESSPKPTEFHRELLPILVSTEDRSGNRLMISITSEGNIHITSSNGTSNQGVTFTLGHLDKGFSEELLSAFTNLALAIQDDETNIQDQSSHSASFPRR